MRALPVLVVLIAACEPYDTDLGSRPYLCGEGERRCPVGYECMDDPVSGLQVCVPSGESIELDCNDDSEYEPNDELSTAMPTPIDMDMVLTHTIPGLAVCPAGDKDVFGIVLASGDRTVDLVISYAEQGAMLHAELLAGAGTPIATGMEVEGMPRTVAASAQNLGPGVYYAQISAPAGINNYSLTISVTGP
jgi:hypothetical protein